MDNEQAIHALINTWLTATKAGDTHRVLELMTDDVVFMVPGQKPFGKEAFRENTMKIGKPGGMRFEGQAHVEEIKILGDWAYARVYLNISIFPPAGEPMHRSGYSLSIYRKESNGQWRLGRDANMVQ